MAPGASRQFFPVPEAGGTPTPGGDPLLLYGDDDHSLGGDEVIATGVAAAHLPASSHVPEEKDWQVILTAAQVDAAGLVDCGDHSEPPPVMHQPANVESSLTQDEVWLNVPLTGSTGPMAELQRAVAVARVQFMPRISKQDWGGEERVI